MARLLLPLGLATAAAFGATVQVQRMGVDRVVLSWPESPAAVLEERARLDNAAAWTPFAGTPVLTAGVWSVEIPPAGMERYFRLRELPVRVPTGVRELSPFPGETGVAVTRETILRFNRPLQAGSEPGTDRLFAESGGRTVLARVETAQDRRSATLFFLENLPAAARITVTFDGNGLRDADGAELDADGDGQAGGTGRWTFSTAGVTGLPGTAVVGRVFASEPAGGANVPLAGVTITVDGAEETLRVVTGVDGAFRLDPAPAGRFFVHVDGRTAVGSHWPGGAYYPFVGKAWEAEPGRPDNPAGGSGEVFLPLVPAAALQPVSATDPTVIGFAPEVLATHPELGGVQIEVPPNALFADNGTRGGRLGMAPVPPDRLPEPLPPGLNLPLVITIQTDGPMNLDRPVPVRFPNLPDPVTGRKLPPGAKSALWSFNHDTGCWEIAGPVTVTPDGNFVVSDPGTGLRQPGWHGVAPGTSPTEPGGGTGGGGGNSGNSDPDCRPREVALDAMLDLADCAGGLVGVDRWVEAGTDLIRNLGDYWEVANEAAEATATSAGSCERVAALVGIFNVAGRTVVDLAQPFLSEADPTRLVTAAVDCGVSTVHNGARLACLTTCRSGSTTSERCDQMNDLFDAGEDLRDLTGTDLTDAGSAVELGIGLAETSGNLLTDALNRHCQGAARRGPGLMGSEATRLELLAAAIRHRDTLAEAATRTRRAVTLGTDARVRLRGWLDLAATRASEWLVADGAWARAYYRLTSDALDFQGQVTPAGEFRLPILGPDRLYRLSVYEPIRRVYAEVAFVSRPSGQITPVPVPRILPRTSAALQADADADGLPDLVEAVIGTRSDRADTDGDGRDDRREVEGGETPLGPARPRDGVTANVPFPGARDLAAVGEDHLVVADTDGRLRVFNTTNPDAPLQVAQVAPDGAEVRLASDRTLLAVGSAAGRLDLYDFGDPARPWRRWQRPTRPLNPAFTVAGDRIYLVDGGHLLGLDALSGEEWFRSELAVAEAVHPLNGRFAVLGGDQLQIFRLNSGGWVPESSVPFSAGTVPPLEWGRRLCGSGLLLVGVSEEGLTTFEAAEGGAWSLVAPPPAGASIVHDAAFLSDTTLGTITSFGNFSTFQVTLFDLSNPTNVARPMVTYETPGEARAVESHRGRLFVADGSAGLTVIRHGPSDTAEGEPRLSLTGEFTTAAAQEGASPYALRARLGGVRGRVEYFLNGTRLGSTTGFPHVWRDVAPVPTRPDEALVFTARAVTSAGLVLTSAPVRVTLAPDLTGPRLLSATPPGGVVADMGSCLAVSVTFNEALAPGTVGEGSFVVEEAGPDLVLGSPDDVVVPGGALTYTATGRLLQRTWPVALSPGRYRVRVAPSVADTAGNAVVGWTSWDFQVEVRREWVSDADGLWGVAANWSEESLPRSGETAWIDRPTADVRVTLLGSPFFPLTIGRLVCREALRVESGIQADRGILCEGPLTLVNGARLQSTNRIDLRGPVTWTGTASPFVVTREFVNAGHAVVNLGANQALYLQSATSVPGSFVNADGAVFELVANGRLGLFGFGTTPQFINRGTLRAVAPADGLNQVTLALDNQGLLEVVSGRLELNSGLTNRGRVVVSAGSRLTVQGGLVDATADASLSGGGEVTLALPSFGSRTNLIGGVIDLGGSLFLSGAPMRFSGDRIAVPVLDVANHAEFTGLALEAGRLVLRNGAVTLATGTAVAVDELDCASARPGDGAGGTLRALTPVTVAGPARVDTLFVTGGGRVQFTGPVSVTNLLAVGDGGRLDLFMPVRMSEAARVEVWAEGELTVTSGLDLALGEGTAWHVSGTLRNEGIVRTADALAGTADLAAGGAVINQGLIEVRSGRLRLPAIHQGSGRIRLAGGVLASPSGITLSGGRLEGTGDCLADLDLAGGTFAPGGDDVGSVNLGRDDSGFGGTFRQRDSGRLQVDVAGTDRHDLVAVAGAVRLGGLLEVRLAPGFVPVLGDTFTFLTGASVEGEFRELQFPALSGGLRFAVRYDPDAVRLRVVGE